MIPNLGFNFTRNNWFNQNEVIVKPGAYKVSEHKYFHRPREEGGPYFPHPADNTRISRIAARIDLDDISRELDKVQKELKDFYVKRQEYRRFLRDLQDLARAAERRIAAPRIADPDSFQRDYRTFLEVIPWILRRARQLGRKPHVAAARKRALAKRYAEEVLGEKLGDSPRKGHWIRLAKDEIEKVFKEENVVTPEYY